MKKHAHTTHHTQKSSNRTREDTANDPARWEALKPLVQGLGIPVIANGDLYTREHVAALRESVGDPSLAVMLARPALYNPSVFRTLKEGGRGREEELEALDEAMRAYLRLCLRYENHVSNSKYTLMEMMCRKRHPDHLKVNVLNNRVLGGRGVLWVMSIDPD